MNKANKHIKVLTFTPSEVSSIEDRVNAVCNHIEEEGGKVVGFLPTTKIGYKPLLLAYTIIYTTRKTAPTADSSSENETIKRIKILRFTYADVDIIEPKVEKEITRLSEEGARILGFLPVATFGINPQHILYHVITSSEVSEAEKGEGNE